LIVGYHGSGCLVSLGDPSNTVGHPFTNFTSSIKITRFAPIPFGGHA
jgi:hypothetical protein